MDIEAGGGGRTPALTMAAMKIKAA